MEDQNYFVNDIFLHVVEAGPKGGKAVVFLHGFPEFWYGWKNQIPYFASKGYRVIAPDQRGYNLSDKPFDTKQYALPLLIRDIADLILTSGKDKVFLVGHDWGGIVAWAVAGHYPELVEKLVILNAPHPEVMRHMIKSNIAQMVKSWYAMFFQLPFFPESILRYKNFAFLRSAMNPSPGKGLSDKNEMVQYIQSWRKNRSITSMLNWYRAARFYENNSTGKITCPTLVLWGEKDASLLAEIARENMKYCENGKLILFPEATHWLQHEFPQEVNEAIEQFIQTPG